ncbi:Haemolymph juvenile hormone binding [Cinara cedri]|uniref:Haemolymph juvenile hormone binding n=1 Tax=Cinara cedri TaxID=506608 RepID=A0A5E4M1S5_9HEMI|nr:Haemolymph juvenile hormone binding [Cinara cedri]
MNECIKNGLQSAYTQLSKGIPSLGLLPTDPLRVTSLGINQGIGAVKLKLDFKDLDILNLHTTIITDLKYDPVNYSMNITLEAQKPIILQGLYKADGKVLILPITGNGTCKFSLDDYKSFSYVQMKPKVKNGNTFLEIDNLSWKFTTSRLHMRLNNLFNGDKILGENMNLFLNENWTDLLNEMQPTFEEALRAALIAIAQQFFNRIPLNDIFTE